MMRGDNKQSFAVLFVDDEEKAQKYFRMAYSDDFQVLTASNVPAALEILRQHGTEIAVLISDQRMPGQQGVDLLRRAREDWPAIVRILTTAYSDLDDAIAAVNRGEILRYVTKPWDIEALRVDLRHAMDFFLLRRDRDLLMAEKFSVRRSMLHSDRLRALLTIAAGLTHLRHAPNAVAAWLHDSIGGATAGQPTAAELELWGLEVRETANLMAIHRSLRRLDDSVVPGYPDYADPLELLRGAGMAVEGRASEIIIQRSLIKPMVASLAKMAGHPAYARLEQRSDKTGNTTFVISVTGSESALNPFTGDLAVDCGEIGLLVPYLIAWHHGGTLTTEITEGQCRFVLTLPKKPSSTPLPKPDEDWLADQFSMLENWQ